MEKLLIIDVEDGLLHYLKQLEETAGIEIHTVSDGYEALEAVERIHPTIAFTAGRIGKLDGIQLLRQLKEVDPDLEVIVVLGNDEKERALAALELGACDSITRPLTEGAVRILLRRAHCRIQMRRKLNEALEEIRKRHDFESQLIRTSMDGIIANDRKGNIVLFNEGATRIYGFSSEEAVAQIHVTRLYPEGEARNIKKKIYSPDYGGAGRLINYKTSALTKSNDLVPILLSATLIFEGAKEVATVGYFKDLTNFKQPAA